MSFDFSKIEQMSKKFKSSNVLEAIIFGAGGAGKSSLCGTLDGKILFIHGSSERHGPKSAKTHSDGEVVQLNIETYSNKDSDPNVAMENLNKLLGDVEGIKKAGFTSIIIDGATELEGIIRRTKKFQVGCLTPKGVRSAFEEPGAVRAQFDEILRKLRILADEGIHYAVTCALTVTDMSRDTGEVLEATPRLSTYSVIENLVLQFPDVILVGEMIKEDKRAHRLQFATDLGKASKDEMGKIKKFLNFKPRLSGVRAVPATLKADLKEVVKLKEAKK